MGSRKKQILILRLVVGIALVLLAWKPIVEIVFTFALGQDPQYGLGGDYELWYRPPWGTCGGIVFWPSKEEPPEHIIAEPILEFALSGPWIIGKTEAGWFAINKESHDVHYPRSPEEIRTATDIDISSIKTETDPTPYLIVPQKALAARQRATQLCWILLFVVPTVLALGPLAISRVANKL